MLRIFLPFSYDPGYPPDTAKIVVANLSSTSSFILDISLDAIDDNISPKSFLSLGELLVFQGLPF